VVNIFHFDLLKKIQPAEIWEYGNDKHTPQLFQTLFSKTETDIVRPSSFHSNKSLSVTFP